MNLDEAKSKLNRARSRLRKLRKEIDYLRQIILEAGEDPNAPKINLTARNNLFFIQWKNGQNFTDIARKNNLSPSTISSICKRIEAILDNPKHSKYHQYSDLLKEIEQHN